MTTIEPALPMDAGSKKRGSGTLETSNTKRVTFASPAERESRVQKQMTVRFGKEGARFRFERLHQGQPCMVDFAETRDVKTICDAHTIYDIVVTAMARHDEETLRQFLDFNNVNRFTFLYPASNLFLPKWHLIVQREQRMVLIGRFQDDIHEFHWQPQIVYEIGLDGYWLPMSAIMSRSEKIGENIMLEAARSNIARADKRTSEFNKPVGDVARTLSEAFLICILNEVVPIVEMSKPGDEAN